MSHYTSPHRNVTQFTLRVSTGEAHIKNLSLRRCGGNVNIEDVKLKKIMEPTENKYLIR